MVLSLLPAASFNSDCDTETYLLTSDLPCEAMQQAMHCTSQSILSICLNKVLVRCNSDRQSQCAQQVSEADVGAGVENGSFICVRL